MATCTDRSSYRGCRGEAGEAGGLGGPQGGDGDTLLPRRGIRGLTPDPSPALWPQLWPCPLPDTGVPCTHVATALPHRGHASPPNECVGWGSVRVQGQGACSAAANTSPGPGRSWRWLWGEARSKGHKDAFKGVSAEPLALLWKR